MSEAGFASLGPSLLARKGGAKPAMRPQLAPIVESEAERAAIAEEALDDLGWNDMGDDYEDDPGENPHEAWEADTDSANIVPISSEARGNATDRSHASYGPVVRRQQKQLLDRVLAEAAMNGEDDELGEEDDLSAKYFDADDEDAATKPVGETAPEPEAEPTEQAASEKLIAEKPARAAARKPTTQAGGATKGSAKRAAFTLRLDTERHLKLRLAATMNNMSAQALVTEALDAMLGEIEELDIIVERMKRN